MPTPMEKQPEPALDYVPIPKERYTSREFARLEWQRMWTRVWLLAGPESILVIRQQDGSLAARFNVCMHRGNRLREPGRGHADELSCLFHGWRYGLDGKLLAALDPHCFKQGLPAERLSLRPVRCETWAGFVFVCLDPNAAPLRDYLGVIPQHLGPYGFEKWKIQFHCTIAIDCNWKTIRLLRQAHAHDLPRGAGEPAPPGRRHGHAGHQGDVPAARGRGRRPLRGRRA
jgi:phenylpropionate dioxygenase-like ring-hydroxylating dioxygenase large terminal subunit